MKTKKKVIFVNPNSGRAKKPGELEKLTTLLQQLPEVEVKLLGKYEDPTALAKRAVKDGASMVAAAGGDGTLNAVATALVNTAIPFGVLPFGTLNHFARDLNIPNDLEKAVGLLEAGTEQSIDVGRVNDRYFLNNSSLGIYPRLVALREKREKELGKWRAYLWACRVALRSPTRLNVRLHATDTTAAQSLKVGLIFVANNQCDVWLPKPGHRACLDNHLLDLYVLEAGNQFRLFSLAWHYLLNRLDAYPGLSHSAQTDFRIESKNRTVKVARDGEVGQMTMPLKYESLKSALCIRVPETESSNSAAST